MEYGYCRISRKTQNIERQVRNIKEAYPNAYIVKETFTGTKIQGRKELDKLLKIIKTGDIIIFDSASRMSRNSSEAMELYETLFNSGIQLVFLKEPHINSETFKKALNNQIKINTTTGNKATDNFIQDITAALNRYTIDLAKEQIELVFNQAQKEVEDLHVRTSEGIKTAKLNGKQIGQTKGTKLTTKKSIETKKIILEKSKDFNGTISDKDLLKITGLARNTFYKYKRELNIERATIN